MRQTRIVKRELPTGIVFVIQFKHPVFAWIWQDAWKLTGDNVKDYFDTLGEAQEKLPLFARFKKKGDVTIEELNKPMKNDYTKDISFWNRLEDFIEQVFVNDLPGEEEKSMILTICRRKKEEYDI